MAKIVGTTKVVKHKVRRRGIHSKKKTSRNKTSKFYAKAYVGQGK